MGRQSGPNSRREIENNSGVTKDFGARWQKQVRLFPKVDNTPIFG